jgi:serine/threonine protein phosphatase PrpC
MFQELLQKHLSRGVLGRKMLSIDKGTIALASDLGLKRAENQDRVSVMKFSSSTTSYTLIAIVDGMGGMRDGEKAAEIAISTFLSSVLENIRFGSEHAMNHATLAANDAVFAFTNGKGGSTLSAILLCSDEQSITVNVGDSRIYAKDSVLGKVMRLSVDDSLAEVVGGSGTELLQFIGMGEGIKPHIAQLTQEVSQVYLTSDGIHYIEPQTLSDIIESSDKVIQVVERLIATARWCGGPDNASICAVDLELLTAAECVDNPTVLEVSDPFGSMQFIWGHSLVEKNHLSEKQTCSKQDNNVTSACEEGKPDHDNDNDNDLISTVEQKKKFSEKEEKKTETKQYSKRKARQPRKKIDKSSSEKDVQIKIRICDDVSDENSEVKDDSAK